MQILKVPTKDQDNVLGKHTELVNITMPKRERYEYIKRLESEIISFSLDLRRISLSNEETSNLALWTASVRNLVHSARSLKSIRHDLTKLVRIDDFHSYKNKYQLIKNTKELYKKLINLLMEKNKDSIFEQLAYLEDSNEDMHDKLVEYIYKTYAKDISTPLNVVREIYSSNKALINAFEEFKFDIQNLTTFENLPRLVR